MKRVASFVFTGSLVLVLPFCCMGEEDRGQLRLCLVFTQIPAGALPESRLNGPRFLPPLRHVAGSRIVCLDLSAQGKPLRVLTPEFAAACSPVVSFDGMRIVFSGKKDRNAPWNVWEMDIEGASKRRIVECSSDCLTPTYLSSIYTLDNLEPRDQVVFASEATEAVNESGWGRAWSLYTCELSGKNLHRITFNLSADFDPTVLPDGRILFSSWQRYGGRYSPTGLFSLLTINTDGTDIFPFYGNHELPVLKCRPVVGEKGWIYFAESDGSDPLGGGCIAAVNLRRNLKTYKVVAHASDRLYFSPSVLPNSRLVVSYKEKGAGATYGLYELAPENGEITQKLFDDPGWHDVEAQAVLPRRRPKGRSSVVNYAVDTADIFCLNCYLSDRPEMKGLAPGSLRRLRVIEGIPLRHSGTDVTALGDHDLSAPQARSYSATPFGPGRILGEIPLPSDGSFYIRVPAETPISFQVLDENDMAVATHRSWMWAMPNEARGCIGCHEDRELTPPNRLAEALKKPAVELTSPPQKRRTVDFRHEIGPLVKARCLQCHTGQHPRLNLAESRRPQAGADSDSPFTLAYDILLSAPPGKAEGVGGRYIKPGSARESPLIWHLFGKRTEGQALAVDFSNGPPARRARANRQASAGATGQAGHSMGQGYTLMPPKAPLSGSERKLFIEWIDLGAQWNNRPLSEDVAKDLLATGAAEKRK